MIGRIRLLHIYTINDPIERFPDYLFQNWTNDDDQNIFELMFNTNYETLIDDDNDVGDRDHDDDDDDDDGNSKDDDNDDDNWNG
ncbi:hypothetical protein HZH68_000440 [Vespula germanica]|uniref:Uncharacterized protein n=1 Tax=Vespula germanica TaxID=30212 RepID=A0A834NTM2_VESGE|nr:hypothetical protein HZH68_000440 [Vespula germanica]